ncbi:MAG TPA: hypothetical protein VFU09_08980, partial [Candidatus Udaeobacter sp.]|nr:hypothetical protein [Candidatus Udaeobacter sp.]
MPVHHDIRLQRPVMPEQLPAMSRNFEKLTSKIERAATDGQLMESSAKNVRSLLAGAPSDLYSRAVEELVAAGEWSELNDRFYQTLAFGTGGLRGRTIGKIVTKAERDDTAHGAVATERPEFPCVGTNAMNFFNISRATQGLVAYLHDWNACEKIVGKPKLVIAHDPRFFSKEFSELAAKVAFENGCDAFVFEGPRSVPELSFAVRYLRASAGVVITASHNPPYDNGYKVYFSDGAQVIEPHASGIIERVNAISSEAYKPLSKDRQGKITIVGKDIDEAYMRRLETLVLDPTVIR